MNYYIQGDSANADKIRAEFEKLGYDTSRHLFNTKSVLYFTLDGEIRATTCNCTPAIIKTHPDYKELELPIEHKFKFKVGDWIVQNDNGTVSQITKVINGTDEYGEYRAYEHTNGYFAACFENEYHLWTIQDAKDVDVLVYQDEIFLVNLVDNNSVLYHCCFDGNLVVHSFYAFSNEDLLHVQPATKEQRDLLFTKIKEAGYEWDADKKELRKIQPHYDIANFKPFDKVLVRYDNTENWKCDLFSHISTSKEYKFVCVGATYSQCIPYEGNEHLLGTTDMPSEEFINW